MQGIPLPEELNFFIPLVSKPPKNLPPSPDVRRKQDKIITHEKVLT